SVPAPSFDLAAADMTQVPLISLRQELPFPGKQGAETAVARAESAVAAASRASVEVSLAAAGARAYHDLSFGRSALEVWRSRLTLAEQAIAVAQVRYETGAAPQTDLLRARLRRAELQEEGRQLDAALAAARARANALRAGTTDSIATPALDAQRALAVAIVATDTARTDTLLLRDLAAGNPELRTALAEVDRAGRMARTFAIAARPDFMVELQTGVRRTGREPFVSGMVGVTVPLWSGRKQAPAARAAQLDAAAAERRYDDLAARLAGDLTGVAANLSALRERIALTTDEIIPLAEAASTSALQRYQVGGLDFTAVLDSQDDLFRARLTLARLIADYGTARARLAALVGEEWYR
ncbi:MAG: TolC family protein, partial [Gemmatimonadetes bacterium]|nr:TolC family protein [Gemmatimonadota bacterium]